MDVKKYFQTYRGLAKLNKVQGLSNLMLALAIFVLAYMAMDKKQTVIIEPVTLTDQAWVQESASSQNFKEAWALFFSDMLGNVSPKSIDFVVAKMGRFLGPRIYQPTMDMMYKQVEAIKQDRVTYRFSVDEVFSEEASGKTFVVGQTYTSGAATEKESMGTMQTFEFKIKIVNYAPVIESLNTYEGRPLTQQEINQRNDKTRQREEAAKKESERAAK